MNDQFPYVLIFTGCTARRCCEVDRSVYYWSVFMNNLWYIRLSENVMCLKANNEFY